MERTIQIRKLARIKIPDAVIAASAETAHTIVVTRNTSDFQRVAGLTVVHPDNVWRSVFILHSFILEMGV